MNHRASFCFLWTLLSFLLFSSTTNSAALPGEEVVIAPLFSRILFAGIDNPVEVGAWGVLTSSLEVQMDDGECRHLEGNKWIIEPSHPSLGFVWVRVSGVDYEGNHWSDSVQMEVRRMPDPYLYLGSGRGHHGQVFRRGIGPVAKNDDFVYSMSYSVVYFDLYFVFQDGTMESTISLGEFYTEEQVELFEKLRSGDHLFATAKVRMPDGTWRMVHASLTIY